MVPNARDAEHYSRELAEQEAVVGSVLTFTGLADEIARRDRVPAAAPERIPAQSWSRAGRFGALGSSASAPPAQSHGFVAAAGGLIAELERSLVTPQRFGQAMRALGRRGPAARAIRGGGGRPLRRLRPTSWRGSGAWTGSSSPGGRSTRCVGSRGAGATMPSSSTASTTCIRSNVTPSRRWREVVGAEVMVSLPYEAGRAALQARAEVVEELRPAGRAGDRAARPGRVLRASVPQGPAPPRATAVRSRAPVDRVGLRTMPWACWRRRGSEPRPSWSPPRCSACFVRAWPRGRSPSSIARWPRRRRSSPRSSPATGSRPPSISGLAFTHTPLGRGLLGLARCALLPEAEATAQDLLDYLRTPGLLERIEVVDAPRARDPPARTQHGGPGPRAAGVRAHRDRRPARARVIPAAELARHARRLQAAPRRRQAAVLDESERLDALALRVLLRAVSELEDLRLAPGGGELIELLERLEVADDRGGRPGAVLIAEPLAIRARRFRAVLRVRAAGGGVPAPGGARAVSLRRAPAGDRRGQRAPAAAERGRARAASATCSTPRSRAPPSVSSSATSSSDEEGNLQLPSPFIADVAELLDAELDRAATPAPAGRPRLATGRRPHRARARAGAGAPRRLRGPVRRRPRYSTCRRPRWPASAIRASSRRERSSSSPAVR